MSLWLSAPLWLLLTALGLGAALLPRRAELVLGAFFGRLVMRLRLFKRKTACDNIRHCLPELGPEGWDALLEKNFEHYGILFFSLHLGFWAMVGGFAALRTGRPLTCVTTVLKPPCLHKSITDCRLSLGVKPAFHPGSLPAVLRALRRNEAVAFMNDQYARPPMGRPVPFFGVRADTLDAPPLQERRLAGFTQLRGPEGKGLARLAEECIIAI